MFERCLAHVRPDSDLGVVDEGLEGDHVRGRILHGGGALLSFQLRRTSGVDVERAFSCRESIP
jgi:hypothetical protein